MSDEVQYSSATESHKRKYEDTVPPPPPSSGGRRSTGFSAPILSPSSDSVASYNSVPPPVDEIQIAKQRAQEIAARIFNDAEAKRPKVENGGFDANVNPLGFDPKPLSSNIPVGSTAISYGFQGTSKKIEIPNGRVGVIIGKAGETIKYLQIQSGAKIQVTRDMDADLTLPTRPVELMGTSDQIAKAEQLINEVLAEAEAGGSGIVSRRVTTQAGSDQFVTKIPNNKVGLVIGKGGETIKNIQARTGARVQVIPLHLPLGDTSTERTVQIDGSHDQIEAAKQLVNEVISGENRLRNPAMTGGYPQQAYQARPQTSWAPGQPQMQQPGYAYMQPGTYPGPSPQYGMSQGSYAGYPQPASGGYPNNWDLNSVQAGQQAQGTGYDYYSQQPLQQQQAAGAPPTDASGYNYNQPPPTGYGQQAYSQDGYSGGYAAPGSQSAYAPPPQNPHQGYEQQQGYNSTPGYGNLTNPPPDGHTPSYGTQGETGPAPPPVQSSTLGQQVYNMGQQQSTPNPAYPAQAGYGMPPTSQSGYIAQPPAQVGYGPGYGAPQAQKAPANPPVYGQPQQSPSQGGGYGQPAQVQPVYPNSQPSPVQSGYAQQPDSTAQRAPPSYGAATAQPGSYPPPYGAPPVAAQSYGQQPPAYNSAYGAAYSQPSAYPADGSAAPASQAPAAQPSGAAKASPQS
ncbi:hypothetical protein Ancab_023014 [Ancistrocladus abbreviatus]